MKREGNGSGADSPPASANESTPEASERQRRREAEDAQRQYERRLREGKEGPADLRSRSKGLTESPEGVSGEDNSSAKGISLDVAERQRQWKARRIESWIQGEDRRRQFQRRLQEEETLAERKKSRSKERTESPESPENPMSEAGIRRIGSPGEGSLPLPPGIEHQPGRTSPVPESTTDWSSLRKTAITIAIVVFAVFIWLTPYPRDAFGRASSMSLWSDAAIAVLASVAYAITRSLRESRANSRRKLELNGLQRQRDTELRARQAALDANVKDRQAVLDRREQVLNGRDDAFRKGVAAGRRWLAEFIAEASSLLDHERESFLLSKKHPAPSAALIVSETRAEKRELRERLKFLEYQLKSYEEYFPQLEEYRDIILDERVPLTSGIDKLEELEAADPTQLYLSREEYEALDVGERNQLALDRYLAKSKNNWEIGRYYERYLGYLREREGWRVEYHGALRGYEDFGRDLVCTKGNVVEIVQAKCWSHSKVIHEKHVFQLYGTTTHFRLDNPFLVVRPVFTTTTRLSDAAAAVAKDLDVRVETTPRPDFYPMIKCNINPTTAERIYHLPFDQQYDRTQIRLHGEFFASSVKEAEERGFRRAFRYRGVLGR